MATIQVPATHSIRRKPVNPLSVVINAPVPPPAQPLPTYTPPPIHRRESPVSPISEPSDPFPVPAVQAEIPTPPQTTHINIQPAVRRKPLDPSAQPRIAIPIATALPPAQSQIPPNPRHQPSKTPTPNRSQSSLNLLSSFQNPPSQTPPPPQPTLSQGPRRLTKPPRVHTPRKPHSRRRLQKLNKKRVPSIQYTPTFVYVLQHDPYPYNTTPGTILGVFSTFSSVTAAALRHGAYAFSREGVVDGSEYLNGTGRIKIVVRAVQWGGYPASQNSSSSSAPKETGIMMPRPHIPHPDDPPPAPSSRPHPQPHQHQHQHQHHTQAQRRRSNASRRSKASSSTRSSTSNSKASSRLNINSVFVAVFKFPTGVECVNVFEDKRKAWGVLLQDVGKAKEGGLLDEYRWMDGQDMPHVKGRISGMGWFEWFVGRFGVDDVGVVEGVEGVGDGVGIGDGEWEWDGQGERGAVRDV